jgi:hypothetical protein
MIVRFFISGDTDIPELDPVAFHRDLGVRAGEELRDHFRDRNVNGPRNKLGARSSGFWGEIMDSVGQPEADATSATVTISDPRINQKVYGGTIKMDDRLLTIPNRPEAYGRSPRLFTNLKVIMFKRPKKAVGALVAADDRKFVGPKVPGKRAKFKRDELGRRPVFYWLLREIGPQAPDPHAFPAEEKLQSALADTAEKHLNRLLA